MGETYVEPASASYRDQVTELMEAGEAFEAVIDAIDEAADLSEGARAELWLLALSMSPGAQAPAAPDPLAPRG